MSKLKKKKSRAREIVGVSEFKYGSALYEAPLLLYLLGNV